jgi:tyrosinase
VKTQSFTQKYFTDLLDPLFFMHHCNLDRIFWEWQLKDLPTRFHQVGGPIVPFDYGGKNVTLDFEVNIGTLAPNVTLEQLLNPQGDVLCYGYANVGH